MVIEIVVLIALIYFTINVGYIVLFAIAGLIFKAKVYQYREPVVSFCVMIPGYKGDDVVIKTITENLKQQYPSKLFDIYLLADSFKPETLKELEKFPIKVLEVHFENSTKSKSINRAFELIEDTYDYVVLLDIDNIMEQQFLQKLNNCLISNIQILQAHRVALNTNNSYAVLDAISEEINNNIFRRGHIVLGLSSSLIGSGKAIGFSFFKDMMRSVDAIGGFDKDLELRILFRRIKIHYIDSAYVFDEKVQHAKSFQNQRRRWLAAQVHYLRKFFLSGFGQLFHGNIDYVNKLFQFTMLPRVLLLGILFFISCMLFIFELNYHNITWVILTLLCLLSLAISVPKKYYTQKTAKALILLPKIFLLYLSNFFRLKNANKKFIHTPHGQTIDKSKK